MNTRLVFIGAFATLYGLIAIAADLTEHDSLFNSMAVPVSAIAVVLVIVAIACGIALVVRRLTEPLIGILASACAAAPLALATPWAVLPDNGLMLAGPSSFVGTLQAGMNPLVVFGVVCFFASAFLPMTALALRGSKRVWLAVVPLVVVELVMLTQIDARAFVIGVAFARQIHSMNAMYAPVGGPLLRMLAVIGAVTIALYKTTKSSGST